MFREAGAADFASVTQLYRQLHPGDAVVPEERAQTVYDEILRTPGMRLFLLEEDGVAIASTYLNVIPNLTRGAAPYGVVENVIVDAARRGTGIGKAVMAGTLQAAWDAGCYKVMLLTGSKRESTHAYYRACGFVAGEKTGFVAHPPS
ncbi:GNAT family N-acetyltransferase [Kribbella albertanoniae]|uniref:GNAT family N-acetyltransferase n=1 Tax=Kribbella albertanoniae TaxID=1266829 RepID=A0A4R4PV82_9ACTN|nr:GNAT family N-acetyltransferase [Kribbella albertanoniae]TDC26366.1 GNAT family N-acetyltransferase [Kribbella albertanoniae]